jgi:hypothetical protein
VAYPAAFRHLRDVGLGRSACTGTLRGIARPGVASEEHARLWTVQGESALQVGRRHRVTKLLSGFISSAGGGSVDGPAAVRPSSR